MKYVFPTIAILLCLLAAMAVADPGDVAMPDAALEAAVEAVIGNDGVAGAVDGNWLVGDGGSSAGAGMNDPDGLVELGSINNLPNEAVMGVNTLTGLEAALNLELMLLGAGTLSSLEPVANLPSLMALGLIDMGADDADMAVLAAGSVSPLILGLINFGLSGPPNDITTTGLNAISQIDSLTDLSLIGIGNELDISSLAGLSLDNLSLDGNPIVGGFEVIGNFTGLTALSLGGTGITSDDLDLVDWSLMTVLEELLLPYNQITDISMLLGLGAPAGALIDLAMNPLDNASICTHVPALRAAGYTVWDDDILPCGSPVLTLTVSGIGEINPGPGEYRYGPGTEVLLSATPRISGGGIFSHWTGNVADPDSTFTSIVMNGDEAVEAVFVSGDYTLTMVHSGGGSGTTGPPPGVWAYMADESVNLNYAVDPGSFWGGWQGDFSGIFPGSILMNANKTVTAVFGDTGYDLTIAVDDELVGFTNPSTGTYSLADGTEVDIVALVLDSTYLFDEWTGDIGAADPGNPYLQVIVDQPRTVTATYAQPVLTIAIVGQGQTSPAAGSHTYPAYTFAEVTATPEAGWRFVGWQGDAEGTGVLDLYMDRDKDITAVFEEIPVYTLTMSVEGSGTTDPAPGVHPYLEGTSALITAIPDAGWRFSHWMGDASGTEPGTSVYMDGDKSVTAVFVRSEFTLTILIEGSGTTNPAAGMYTYAENTVVPITAEPAEQWKFARWLGDAAGETPSTSVIMDGDKIVTAVFEEKTYLLTITVLGEGSTTPAMGEHFYPFGTSVMVMATAEEGWQFVRWEGDASGTVAFTSVIMDADKSIVAVFEAEPADVPHPADLNEDFRIGLSEAIAYLAGWQQGANPIGYAIRAAYLWQNGEVYAYDETKAPPLCWVLAK
ncbi:MAG TPA: hypothetical protein PKO23_12760 [Candidatus Hydrogenedentes bacterium]|nr:hypothetical protein [Candidatus Hydrogenedentota bacterium]